MSQSYRPPRGDENVRTKGPRVPVESFGEGMRACMQLPDRGIGEDQLERVRQEVRHDPVYLGENAQVVAFPPHLRRLFASMSEPDVDRFEKLLALDPKTIVWISEKNTKELTNLDGAVEFITSSRTAARVLMWVCGTAVAFVGGVVALTKSGIDMFSIIRGGK
ncbi:hypothetical protein G3T14_19575 [Methylobacterium sp. BTF04]|uniref:hypothetical protein n=1 Tax=Methylobacterium sp. BTF04 TaxID=2708300 RepID=UPI0013CFCCAB|nr:hypothetical protein [Methylobacterium sp. BTF04]NEU14310.1 hypothetical protein [Methylobacterium sp. BTF04]